LAIGSKGGWPAPQERPGGSRSLAPVAHDGRVEGAVRAVEAACAQLFQRQYGLIAGEHAIAAGMTRAAIARRARSGVWLRFLPRVYALRGVPRTWHQAALATCLSIGDACLSHSAAAPHWELDGFSRGRIEVITARRPRPLPNAVVHKVRQIPRRHRRAVASIPVTCPELTLIDVAGCVDEVTLDLAFEDALRRGLTTIDRVAGMLAQRSRHGHKGSGAIADLLNRRMSDRRTTESALEMRLYRLLEDEPLPLPIPQFEIRSKGGLLARVDFAYPELKLALEADGHRFHSGRRDWEHDLRRINRLTTAGWRVLRFSWTDLTERPREVIGIIRSAFRECL
jgi:very-short-patch-repair endonuclease